MLVIHAMGDEIELAVHHRTMAREQDNRHVLAAPRAMLRSVAASASKIPAFVAKLSHRNMGSTSA